MKKNKLVILIILLLSQHQLVAQVKIKTARQKDIEQALESIHSYKNINKSYKSSVLPYNQSRYFTEQARKKLLLIIRDGWTQEEKLNAAEQYIIKSINNEIEFWEKVVKDTVNHKLREGDRVKYKNYVDSLNRFLNNSDKINIPVYQNSIMEIIKQIESKKIFNELIYTSAMLSDDRFIPILKQSLKDSIHYDPFAVKMALARFGVEPYKTKILKSYYIDLSKNNWHSRQNYYASVLFYLCTQESVYEYSKLLNVKYHGVIEADDYMIISVPSETISNLQNIILNKDFQNYLSKVEYIPESIKKKNINWVKKWIKENYGNYELNRDYYPGF